MKKKNKKIKKIKEKIKKIKNQKNLVRFFSSASPLDAFKLVISGRLPSLLLDSQLEELDVGYSDS